MSKELTPPLPISRLELAHYLHLPINNAAVELEVSTTLLKKVCRTYGIRRWPQRKVTALRRRITSYETEFRHVSSQQRQQALLMLIHSTREELSAILYGPTPTSNLQGDSQRSSAGSTHLALPAPKSLKRPYYAMNTSSPSSSPSNFISLPSSTSTTMSASTGMSTSVSMSSSTGGAMAYTPPLAISPVPAHTPVASSNVVVRAPTPLRAAPSVASVASTDDTSTSALSTLASASATTPPPYKKPRLSVPTSNESSPVVSSPTASPTSPTPIPTTAPSPTATAVPPSQPHSFAPANPLMVQQPFYTPTYAHSTALPMVPPPGMAAYYPMNPDMQRPPASATANATAAAPATTMPSKAVGIPHMPSTYPQAVPSLPQHMAAHSHPLKVNPTMASDYPRVPTPAPRFYW